MSQAPHANLPIAGNSHDGLPRTAPAASFTVERVLEKIAAEEAVAPKPRLRLITSVIERQIIPQIVIAHRAAAGDAASVPSIGDTEVTHFTHHVLAHDLTACLACVAELGARGVSLVDVCVDLLTRSARRLGDMWDEDRCSFIDVTAGLGMLHTLLHRIKRDHATDIPVRDAERTLLLTSLPGEHHTFGLQMVAELFRHSGWDVAIHPALSDAELIDTVANEHFAIAGMSISAEHQAHDVGSRIREIRHHSVNRTIGVLIGGPALTTRPDLVTFVGADLSAADGKQAVFRAEGLRVLAAALSHRPAQTAA